MTAGSIAVPQIIPLRVPLPGKSKHDIDTNTPVEIKSDTHDVSIHYTLDGNAPDLFRKPGYGENSTLKYRGPFTLPEGKVTVKAIAVRKDGKESGVVTKVFRVEYIPSCLASSDEDNEDDDENFLKDYTKDIFRQDSQEGSVFVTSALNKTMQKEKNSTWNEATQKFQGMKIEGSNTHKFPKGPRFLNTRLGIPASHQEPNSTLQTDRSQFAESIDTSARKNLTSTQIMRIQKETDFLRCAYCLAPRPSDPFARFCHECGSAVPPVPGRRLPPPEGAQMGLCVECKTMVPLNTPTCIVCEAPIPPQLQPQASIRMKGKNVCRSCGTGNPINIKHCVTCETRLPDTQQSILNDNFIPPPPSPEVKMLTCSKCGRVNNLNARFCDWCGSKPGLPVNYLTCSKCGATSHPYAHFCGSCGSYLEPPVRIDSHNSMLMRSVDNNVHSEMRDFKSPVAWQPITVALPSPNVNMTEKTDQATQTVGLFYPSSKDLEKRETELISEKERQQKMSDRKPLLTAISPGNGYWRKQIDHICAHLRSYAQNNTEFRALIGSPRMGKMSSATVHEDGYEVSLRLNFVLAGNKDLLVGKTLKISEDNFLSSITEGRGHYGSQNSLASETSSTATDTNVKTKKKPKKKKILTKEDKLPPDDRLLLKEVGPNGGGRISMVQQLLDEGADPNCTNNDDRPVLTVAVLNKHHEVIPVLIQKGADIDQKSGLLGNTALHEATLLGAQGLKCAEVLLGCNASIKKKNDKDLTAHDLAVKTGNEQLISLFASKMGQGMLDKLTKSRHVSLDVF